MAQGLTVEEILEILKSSKFDALIGSIESANLEAKGIPYQLSAGDPQKHELAKDVAALANANGGIILLGFRTAKNPNTAEESIDACRPFERTLIDIDQYRNVLQAWIYPPVHSVQIDYYPDTVASGKGVAAIVVLPTFSERKTLCCDPKCSTRWQSSRYPDRLLR